MQTSALFSRSNSVEADRPTFTLADIGREWRVRITWPDGEEGPAIAFASRQDAELWLARDADAWLDRLAAANRS